ncbi:MAG TPA: hypothetical protein VLH39_02635 [Magnetospirillaceae bacterium]|nr:hypothetical protein [Magnetospirillaceae bacterium]
MTDSGKHRASLALTLCLAAAMASGLTGCSKPEAPPPPHAYPASFAQGSILRVAQGGLVHAEPGNAPQGPGAPYGTATAVTAVVALDGRTVVLALNRIGLVLLRVNPELRRYRLYPASAAAEFAGRSVGAFFHRGGELFCLLFRDPVFETEPARYPPAVLLAAPVSTLPEGVHPRDLRLGHKGGDLFALFPTQDGSWILHLRREVPEGFVSSFLAYAPESGTSATLDRSGFEKALAPRPLAQAPESIRRAALALTPKGVPAVVSVSLADGSRAVYVFGDGKPEDTVELRGAASENGAVLVAWNAVAAWAREGSEVFAFRLPVPVQGAVYRDAVPLSGAVLAVWEAGDFPNVVDSGVVLLPTP